MYYVNEIKASEKGYDGIADQEFPFTGEWQIKTLDGDIMLTTTVSRKYADKIVGLLHQELYPKFELGDIVQLSRLIRKYLKDTILKNPTCDYNILTFSVLGMLMRDNNDNDSDYKPLDADFAIKLIQHERKVFEEIDKNDIPNLFLP